MTDKFSLAQQRMLALAIGADDSFGVPPESRLTARSLLRRGLLKEEKADDGECRYAITMDGFKAAGAEPPCDSQQADEPGAPAEDEPSAPEQVGEREPPISEHSGPPPKAEAKAQGKGERVIGLLRRPEGTTVPQMVEATGWLTHSVRGFMSGALKKKQGLTIVSEKTEGGRVYRIADEVVGG